MRSVTLVIGGSRAARDSAVAERGRLHARRQVHDVPAANWPFLRQLGAGVPAAGSVLIITRRLERAFPDAQTNTRLVLTQSTYQMQRWLDWLERRGDASLVAEASETALRRHAPEAFAARGPWSKVEWIELPREESDAADDGWLADEPYGELSTAFRVPDSADRLARCRRAAEARPDDAVVQVALASAYMEVGDLDAAQPALERAITLDPGWEAAHFELGKLYLRRDDLLAASTAFAEAGRLMPGFAAAFSNLGATLGELDRGEEALDAFRQALRYDPTGYTILNNLGVVSRELGRLDESEAAFRKVVALAPEFVFGHYNLGHTLFLQGRYRAALAAYEEGQRRDPERNARQACRLAVVRLAAGDAQGSLADLRRSVAGVSGDQKREMLMEAREILWALVTDRPGLPGWKQVADTVQSELEAT